MHFLAAMNILRLAAQWLFMRSASCRIHKLKWLALCTCQRLWSCECSLAHKRTGVLIHAYMRTSHECMVLWVYQQSKPLTYVHVIRLLALYEIVKAKRVLVCVCVCVWERERERETDKQTDRQTETENTAGLQKFCMLINIPFCMTDSSLSLAYSRIARTYYCLRVCDTLPLLPVFLLICSL
jgi:hypothetical protein